MAVYINSIYIYIYVYHQYIVSMLNIDTCHHNGRFWTNFISVSCRSWSRDPERVVVGKNVSWIDFWMRIPTIPSDLSSLPTYWASDALDFAEKIGLRTGTRWNKVNKCATIILELWNPGIRTQQRRPNLIVLCLLNWIDFVFAAISVFSFDLPCPEGVQYVLVIPSAVPVSSCGRRLRLWMSRDADVWTKRLAAKVGFPYDTSLMFFWEFYSMGMPMFAGHPEWYKVALWFFNHKLI